MKTVIGYMINVREIFCHISYALTDRRNSSKKYNQIIQSDYQIVLGDGPEVMERFFSKSYAERKLLEELRDPYCHVKVTCCHGVRVRKPLVSFCVK